MTATSVQLSAFGLIQMGYTRDEIDGTPSLIQLIGAGPAFWPIFQRSTEFLDGKPDPLDRWSTRVLLDVQTQTGANSAVFPFGGPPYAPFLRWAAETDEAWQSPVGMLVHCKAGMMISYRGALIFPNAKVDQRTVGNSPCDTCSGTPCATACPVGALSGTALYDVPRCKSYLLSEDGADCMTNGCKARRACPISQRFDRNPEQSAFHMAAFMPNKQRRA